MGSCALAILWYNNLTMHVSTNTHNIAPGPTVQDCPVLYFDNQVISVETPTTANPIEGLLDKSWYAIGPFACNLCVYKCQDARIMATVKALAKAGGFDIDETPVAIGVRMAPKGKTEIGATSLAKTDGDQASSTSSEASGIESVDAMLDDLADLSDPDTQVILDDEGRLGIVPQPPEGRLG